MIVQAERISNRLLRNCTFVFLVLLLIMRSLDVPYDFIFLRSCVGFRSIFQKIIGNWLYAGSVQIPYSIPIFMRLLCFPSLSAYQVTKKPPFPMKDPRIPHVFIHSFIQFSIGLCLGRYVSSASSRTNVWFVERQHSLIFTVFFFYFSVIISLAVISPISWHTHTPIHFLLSHPLYCCFFRLRKVSQ